MKLFSYVEKSIRVIFGLTICMILYLVFRYQEDYRGNRALFGSAETYMIAFSCICMLAGLNIFRKKRAIYLKFSLDRVIVWLTAAIWLVSLYIFYNIYFRTGWDVWTIDYGAKVLLQKAEYIDWLDWYFGRYPNNIFLTYIYAAALKINDLFGVLDTENGQMVFIGLNSLAGCASSWLVYDCVKKICNKWTAVIGWGCCILLVSLSPWTTIPYSDAVTVFIPVLIFWLFLKINCKKNYVFWTAIFFLGIMGGHLKPQVLIVVIAVSLCRILELKKENVKDLFIVLAFCTAGVIAAQYSYHILYQNFSEKVPFQSEAEVSWQYFFMMGLNNSSNGMWNEDDVNFSSSFETKEERDQQCMKKAEERLKELGLINYVHLINRKLTICFSDGTFSWSRNLGDFYAEIYEEKNQFSSPYLRDLYYYDGSNYPLNAAVRQICWCSILILVFFSGFHAIDKRQMVLMLTLIGCAMFEVIFEAATRHLYCNIPLFIILAMIELSRLDRIFFQRHSKGIWKKWQLRGKRR